MKTKLNIAIVALAATVTSCYDVLDKVPTDRYTDAVVWNDPALLDMYLAELYACSPRNICLAPERFITLCLYAGDG